MTPRACVVADAALAATSVVVAAALAAAGAGGYTPGIRRGGRR